MDLKKISVELQSLIERYNITLKKVPITCTVEYIGDEAPEEKIGKLAPKGVAEKMAQLAIIYPRLQNFGKFALENMQLTPREIVALAEADFVKLIDLSHPKKLATEAEKKDLQPTKVVFAEITEYGLM